MKFFLLGLLVWNFVTFTLMGLDKRRAKKGKWRISERTLLGTAFLLGAYGATAGMFFFRHKTKHWYFRLLLPLFAILQTALYLCVLRLF